MPRGGARAGAGRPKGTGRFGEKTVPVRVPVSLLDEVQSFIDARGYSVPFFSCKVAAGSPTWADEHIDRHITLAPDLAPNRDQTFCVQADGESMLNAGIELGDILVVDKSLPASHGKIVVAAVDGELTVKRLWQEDGELSLMPENEDYVPIKISEGNSFHIWGVVTSIIKKAA